MWIHQPVDTFGVNPHKEKKVDESKIPSNAILTAELKVIQSALPMLFASNESMVPNHIPMAIVSANQSDMEVYLHINMQVYQGHVQMTHKLLLSRSLVYQI